MRILPNIEFEPGLAWPCVVLPFGAVTIARHYLLLFPQNPDKAQAIHLLQLEAAALPDFQNYISFVNGERLLVSFPPTYPFLCLPNIMDYTVGPNGLYRARNEQYT